MAETQTPTPVQKPATELVTVDKRVVMPAVSGTEALEAWQQYQDLKNKILDRETDIQVIRNEEFKKKSYWRKVATFFNLSIETKEEYKETIGRTLVWHFTVRATAPNGRSVEGVGSCDIYEKATLRDGKYQTYNSYKNQWEDAVPNSLHNTRSTAYTRAYNRAVSDLVGGGEVSAEEVDQGQHAVPTSSQTAVQVTKHLASQAAPAKRVARDLPCEVPGCSREVWKSKESETRQLYNGHIICFQHAKEDWPSFLESTGDAGTTSNDTEDPTYITYPDGAVVEQ